MAEVVTSRVEELAASSDDPLIRPSLFRAFDPDEFVEWSAWDKLASVLANNGGAYALAGPRGAGKSWLMLNALWEERRRGGVWLWYPCPSDYDAYDFLSTLSDNFANQIERRYRPDRLTPSLASSPWRLVLGLLLVTLAAVLALRVPTLFDWVATLALAALVGTLALLLLLYWRTLVVTDGGEAETSTRDRLRRLLAFAFYSLRLRSRGRVMWLVVPCFALAAWLYWLSRPDPGSYRDLILAGVAFLCGSALLVLTLARVRRERTGEAELIREAALLRERIRFTATLKEATELGGQAAASGIGARLRTSRQRELVERPTTVSSLIHDFRALAERAGEVAGRVVIAIDELDKISDAGAVRELLRDIKGIFEVPRVHFLVSISDEATRELKLGSLSERNEFHSSFYTVIDLEPFAGHAVEELSQKRNIALAPPLMAKLALMARGNPRELLRLADLAIDATRGVKDPEAVMAAIMWTEARALRAEALRATTSMGEPALDQAAGRDLCVDIAAPRFARGCFVSHTRRIYAKDWDPPWSNSYWETHFGEAWRRLLVRAMIAALLVEEAIDPHEADGVLAAAEESASVAQALLADAVID